MCYKCIINLHIYYIDYIILFMYIHFKNDLPQVNTNIK